MYLSEGGRGSGGSLVVVLGLVAGSSVGSREARRLAND